MAEKIGFIGLGKMGIGMAHNVLKKTGQLTIYNSSSERVKDLAKLGAEVAVSIADLGSECSLILLCLSGTQAVEDVLFGAGKLADNSKPGNLIIDFSTIDYLATVKLHARLSEQRLEYVDAPVSGWPAKAMEGTLSVIVGGEPAQVERALPFLNAVGNNVSYMGKPGNGQLTKLASQAIYNLNIAAMAEVYPMAMKLGLDPEKLVEVTTKSACRSFALESFSAQILDNKFKVNYSLKNAYKDLESLLGIISSLNIPMPLTQALTTVYQNALRQGLGDEDKGALIKVYEKLLGVEFRRKHQ
jgi:3-hydroxyisobutyrate dehydrogenase-like beta-hydroxyacid dehydrogenase